MTASNGRLIRHVYAVQMVDTYTHAQVRAQIRMAEQEIAALESHASAVPARSTAASPASSFQELSRQTTEELKRSKEVHCMCIYARES